MHRKLKANDFLNETAAKWVEPESKSFFKRPKISMDEPEDVYSGLFPKQVILPELF